MTELRQKYEKETGSNYEEEPYGYTLWLEEVYIFNLEAQLKAKDKLLGECREENNKLMAWLFDEMHTYQSSHAKGWVAHRDRGLELLKGAS